MTDWTLIAGGRCPGQPWRVGIAGFAFKNQQVFLLSDEDWERLATLAPLEPLIAYGKGNGLSFERIMPGDTPALDGVLLFAPGWKGQPLVSLPEGVRRYIALTGAKLRSELADESLFAKLFLPIDLPPYGERLIYLNQHVLRDPACPPDAWAVEKDAHDKDHSRSYSRSADFWIQRITTAIASDAADQRSVRPLLSVVIPTYNHGRFLRQSVRSALDQGVDDIEVVVLDNASTDETAEVMASLVADRRVRYIRNRYNYGPGFNWGNGLQVASGRYIAFLSADDYFNPGHLTRLLSVLQARPDIAVGYSGITWVDGDGQPMNQPRHPGYHACDYVGGRNEVADLLIHDNYMAPSAVVFDRQALRATWVPVRNGGAGDWDMSIQMAERFPDFAYIDTPGVSYRWHGAQHSQQHFYSSTAPLADHLTIVEGVFQRNAQHHLKGREREVAAHIRRRLALYPGEEASPLGARARALIERLETLRQSHEAPLFSIILTTYNRPAMLKDALASIGEQRFRDFEVVLVNDHGEPVEALLAGLDFPVTYLYQGRNGGPAAARNAALKLTQGRYVAYLDDDDRFLPDHLQVLAEAVEAWPDDVLYTDAVFVTELVEQGKRVELAREQRYPHDAYSKERLFVNNYIPVNTFACPRSLAASNGGFDESLEGLEDWDFLMRLAARVPFRHVQAETVEVRLRAAELEPDRRSLLALKNYPELYRELYSRHSDLGNEEVREARWDLLARFATFEPEPAPVLSVQDWLQSRSLTPVSRRLIEERLQANAQGPSFGVLILDLSGESEALSVTLASLRQLQCIAERVQPVVMTVAHPPADVFSGTVIPVSMDNLIAPLNDLLRSAAFDWFLLVKAGDQLTANGLLVASLELLLAPECRAVYCDELYRQEGGALGPAFRPDFNLDYLLSFPAAMARHWLLRREVVVSAGGFSASHPEAAEFELILRLITLGGLDGLGHVAEPLLVTDAPVLANIEDERRAIIEHLQARGYAQAQVLASSPGRYRLRYAHAEQPLVSCLVMAGGQLAQVRRCIESLMETTAYPYYEILLVETAPASESVHQWLKALESLAEERLRVVWQKAPERSPALSLNHAATLATGDYLLLLAPETAVIDAAWLDELLNHAQRPEVGVVGAKLLGADGRVRDAGLVLGLDGVAGRVFEGESMDAGGYMQRLQVDQNYSAVTDACLMIRRSLYEEIGGLDARIADSSNSSVDLCLKVASAGYLTVWAAHAVLMHDGEAGHPEVDPTAQDEQTRRFVAEQDAMFSKWLPQISADRAYNRNLSLSGAGFSLEPDVQLTWRPLESWQPLPVVLAHPADPWGCGHYRVIQPFQAMHDAGLIDGMTSQGLLSVADLARYAPDVIVLQRQLGEARLEAMRGIQQFSQAFKVYELDDYLLNLPMKSMHREQMPRDILKSLRRGLGFVDRFVVSTAPLAEAFKGLHDDIRVVENRLPLPWWGALSSRRQRGRKPRVGWAGGHGHAGDLELIFDVVRDLAEEVEWVFLGMCPEKMLPYVAEYHPGVPIDAYPAHLASLDLDLALAPVEQNLFNDCKSNLRLLEYGACGFPVVCSDVACYRGDLPVTRVKNRYKDWMAAIRMHLDDLSAAALLGDQLKEKVRAEWMLEGANLQAWLAAWSGR